MYNHEIVKLSKQFYIDYPSNKYPEILHNIDRRYDLVIFELEILKDCYVAVPFRSEMNHTNGYRFRHSIRSQTHSSGLDYSKMLIIKKEEYIAAPSIIDADEYIEFERNELKIHAEVEKYIKKYIDHIKGIQILHHKQFIRKYQYSTLKYFHYELGLTFY